MGDLILTPPKRKCVTVSGHIMPDYSTHKLALEGYLNSSAQLKELGIITNKKDFTCQIGEWFVAMLYDGQRAISGIQKYWDIQTGNKKIQVKTHAKALGNKNRWSAIKYDEYAEIDELIIVVFSHDYKLITFYKTPWEIALTRIRRNKDRDIIRWDDLAEFEIEADQLPKQEVVSLFK